jgi:hypothetical protein
LGTTGYGLAAEDARRVVEQELQVSAGDGGDGDSSRILAYRETFLALKQDGQITPEERKVLETLASNLGISKEQALRAEAGGK